MIKQKALISTIERIQSDSNISINICTLEGQSLFKPSDPSTAVLCNIVNMYESSEIVLESDKRIIMGKYGDLVVIVQGNDELGVLRLKFVKVVELLKPILCQ